MRAPLVLGLATIVGFLGAIAPLAVAARVRDDVFPLEQLRKGMKGFGLTVFEGTRPERFDVEVLDVLRNFRPHQDLVLIKTEHPRLEVTKIVAGMSGSPIYINGKMLGAYAYGWSFGAEAVAGVTPIAAMLSDLDRPLPAFLRGRPLPGGSHSSGFRSASVPPGYSDTNPTGYNLESHATHLAERARGAGAAQPVATPLLLGGLTKGAAQAASRWLEPLGLVPVEGGGAGAQAQQRAAEPFVDGGAIGVELIGGDMSAMGVGTVTRVEGEKLVAFGHPMMEGGITALPTAQARILWFMASIQRSFKIGESMGRRGTLVNDRQSSIVVDQSMEPARVPVQLAIVGEPGAPHPKWNFTLAHDPFLTPAFLAVAVGSGLESTASEHRDVTYVMRSTVRFTGLPELKILDYGSSPTGTPDSNSVAQSNLLAAVGGLFSNPWQDVSLESIDVSVELKFARDYVNLRGVDVLTPIVDPGEPARLRLWLTPFAGPAFPLVVSVPMPAHLEGQTVRLQVRPGYTVSRLKAAPESLQDLARNLADPTYEARSVVVSIDTGLGSVAHKGVIAEGVPAGVLERLATTSTSVGPAELRAYQHSVTKLEQFLVGSESVTVQVRSLP